MRTTCEKNCWGMCLLRVEDGEKGFQTFTWKKFHHSTTWGEEIHLGKTPESYSCALIKAVAVFVRVSSSYENQRKSNKNEVEIQNGLANRLEPTDTAREGGDAAWGWGEKGGNVKGEGTERKFKVRALKIHRWLSLEWTSEGLGTPTV